MFGRVSIDWPFWWRCSKCGEKKAEFVHNTPLTQAEESRYRRGEGILIDCLPNFLFDLLVPFWPFFSSFFFVLSSISSFFPYIPYVFLFCFVFLSCVKKITWLRKEADLAMDLKALPERRRRTFLRYLNGKKKGNKKTPVLVSEAS